MARKETITIQTILDTAFAMTREEGMSNVTARKVAAKVGCSTQPIFRVYKNMEELWKSFFKTIAIKERVNKKCQQNFMPKKYWKNILEMEDEQ